MHDACTTSALVHRIQPTVIEISEQVIISRMGSIESAHPANGDITNLKHTTSMIVELVDDSQQPPLDTEPKDDWVYPWLTDFKISEHPIDEIRKLKVVVIGAGLAGITAGALLPAKVPGIDLTILEKNANVGGTWFENIYPGVRCDIPAHVYQSTFSPNSQWTEEYAQGKEILAYWQAVARKHNVYEYIRFKTMVVGAYWEPARAQWRVETVNLANDQRSSEQYDYVITAIGHFNEWKLPDYPGIKDFKGPLFHSSNYDPTFDPKGKRIATIGNGASGVQVTTELQKLADHVDHYTRNRTWIAGSFNP